MYKLTTRHGEATGVQKIDGNHVLCIPFDPANTDYQAYLAWVAEGNTPEPADEVTGG
jgi:hypothetical protein